MEAIELANEIENKVNVMGNGETMKTLVVRLSSMHRTLMQSFVGRFIIPFIKQVAMNYKNGYYDARNETACKICSLMFDGLCKDYPWYKNEDLDLPLI